MSQLGTRGIVLSPSQKVGVTFEPKQSRSKCRLLSQHCAASQDTGRHLLWSLAHKCACTTLAISIVIINVIVVVITTVVIVYKSTVFPSPGISWLRTTPPPSPNQIHIASPSLAVEVMYEMRIDLGRLEAEMRQVGKGTCQGSVWLEQGVTEEQQVTKQRLVGPDHRAHGRLYQAVRHSPAGNEELRKFLGWRRSN